MSQHPEKLKPKWRRWLVPIALVLLPLCFIASFGCASWQRRLIYYPPVFDTATADKLGAEAKLERWFDAKGNLIGWKRLSPVQPSEGRILIAYGNGGAAVYCGRYADVIQQVTPVDVFIVDYPGYADRPGRPTEKALEEAADEAFQLLAANGPVYVLGESLGTGVAAYLAGKHPEQTAGVVLLAPYSNLSDVAQAHMRFVPVRAILADRYPSDKHLRSYHGPVAMVVADGDRVVPARFGRRLYEGYEGPKRLWDFPGGDHGTVMVQPPQVWREIFSFLRAGGLGRAPLNEGRADGP